MQLPSQMRNGLFMLPCLRQQPLMTQSQMHKHVPARASHGYPAISVYTRVYTAIKVISFFISLESKMYS